MHSVLRVASTSPLILKREDFFSKMSGHEKIFYRKFVEKSIDEILEVAAITKGQAAVGRFGSFLNAHFWCLNGYFLF